ncbi:MAG: hypothetical protein ABI068_03080 [Ktedonobacterales bacterium]
MTAGILGHLWRGFWRALGQIILWFLIGFVIAALIVEAVGYFEGGLHFPPSLLTDIAAIVMGLAIGYAAGLTVLVFAVVRLLVETVQGLEKDVKGEMAAPAKVIESVIENVEKRI